jgi:hypothetical protein
VAPAAGAAHPPVTGQVRGEKIREARAEEEAELEKVLTEDQLARLKYLRKGTPAKGP